MISQNLKIIQLVNSDGNHSGLYLTERDDIENFQEFFDAAFSNLDMKQDCVHEDADDWLAEHKGIYRYFAEEVTTESI